jgi:hypothetical protein
VEKAVESSDVIAVFLSSKALDNSGYLHKEIRIALDAAERLPEGSIKVVPIRLDDHEVPRRLQHLHWIDSDHMTFEPRVSKAYRTFKPRASKGVDLNDVFAKLDVLQEFSIGGGYLQLQRAILASEQRATDWRQQWCEPGTRSETQTAEFLVRGQKRDGRLYYGRASMQITATSDVVLRCFIERSVFTYRGSLRDTEVDLEGLHKVHYWIDATGGLAVGIWDDGGLEELISSKANRYLL